MRRSLTVLFVAMTAALATVGPAQAEGPVTSVAPGCTNDFDYQLCFNDPTSSDVQTRGMIFKPLREMINLAVAGDEIRAVMFSWTGAGHGVARALARAKAKQADVRVIVGSRASKNRVSFLQKHGVAVKVCQTACISKQGINRVKLFLGSWERSSTRS
jgi:hypothetical protein